MKAVYSSVLNRGKPSESFITELIRWGKTAPDSIFTPNANADIYGKVRAELGPYESIPHRRAVMLEVMRVLAGFESSWNWKEGTDESKAVANNAENAEAGAWQVSYDARKIASELRTLAVLRGITNGSEFQRITKQDHDFAMEFVARLMRFTTQHNGPLYKGAERNEIRASLRGAEHSIYPWLSRDAVKEFETALS